MIGSSNYELFVLAFLSSLLYHVKGGEEGEGGRPFLKGMCYRAMPTPQAPRHTKKKKRSLSSKPKEVRQQGCRWKRWRVQLHAYLLNASKCFPDCADQEFSDRLREISIPRSLTRWHVATRFDHLRAASSEIGHLPRDGPDAWKRVKRWKRPKSLQRSSQDFGSRSS